MSIRHSGPSQGGRDELNIVQIEQDMALCHEKYSNLVCLPVAAQFMRDDVIALFSFESIEEPVKVLDKKHYRLVDPSELTAEDLAAYRRRTLGRKHIVRSGLGVQRHR